METNTDLELATGEPGMDRRLPATVLVGFLGAGKTTLLNHLLQEEHGRKLAVIVNDFSEVNIDASLVRRDNARLVEMTNGCICCTLREDLVDALTELAREPGLDGVVIESTGIGEPLPIAQAFYMGELPDLVRLDDMVTVVDAAHFWSDFARAGEIETGAAEPVIAPLAPLLVDQIEFSTVILLNKCDLAAAADLDRLEGFVRGLNPDARVFRTTRGELPLTELRTAPGYDYETGPRREDWAETLGDNASEADEFGFNSFSWLSPEPFRHAAFLEMFEDWPDGVLRAKGYARFIDHPPLVFSVVRDQMEIQVLAGDDEFTGTATEDPDEPFDSEIVVIGQGLDVAAIGALFDGCLAG